MIAVFIAAQLMDCVTVIQKGINMLLKLSEVVEWDRERWPNFTPSELACLCSLCQGEFYHDDASFDAIQKVRDLLGKPIIINSGHRCVAHNRVVDGKRFSRHLKIAFDVSLEGRDKKEMLLAAIESGFTGIGMYSTFMHLDLGRKRHWFGGGKSSELWLEILKEVKL